jgi:hypothetical protein
MKPPLTTVWIDYYPRVSSVKGGIAIYRQVGREWGYHLGHVASQRRICGRIKTFVEADAIRAALLKTPVDWAAQDDWLKGHYAECQAVLMGKEER